MSAQRKSPTKKRKSPASGRGKGKAHASKKPKSAKKPKKRNKKRFLWSNALHVRFLIGMFDWAVENLDKDDLYQELSKLVPSGKFSKAEALAHFDAYLEQSRSSREALIKRCDATVVADYKNGAYVPPEGFNSSICFTEYPIKVNEQHPAAAAPAKSRQNAGKSEAKGEREAVPTATNRRKQGHDVQRPATFELDGAPRRDMSLAVASTANAAVVAAAAVASGSMDWLPTDPATGRPKSGSFGLGPGSEALWRRRGSFGYGSALAPGSPGRRTRGGSIDSVGSADAGSYYDIADSLKNTGQQMLQQMRLHREMSARQATQITRYGNYGSLEDLDFTTMSPIKLQQATVSNEPTDFDLDGIGNGYNDIKDVEVEAAAAMPDTEQGLFDFLYDN